MRVAAALITAATLNGQTPPLTATLQLSPDTTLPGTPVAFLITVNNPGEQPAKIANALSLHVTTSTAVFDAKGLLSRDIVSLPIQQMEKLGNEGLYELTIPAHAQRTIYVDIGPQLSDNEFFTDHRLSFPGVYLLQAELTSYAAGYGATASVMTNMARLTIETPRGADAAVWSFLLAQTSGNGWGTYEWMMAEERIAPALRSQFPGSRYLMWVAAMGRGRTLQAILGPIETALSGAPPLALRDDLLWAKAAALAGYSSHALRSERDIDKALMLADQSRQAYTLLKDEAVSGYLRTIAADALQHLYTRRLAEDDLRFYAQMDLPAPKPLSPRVECVTRMEGHSFSARFGYTNPNSTWKMVPIGNLNQVTPADRDQGQPKAFKPGDHANAFTAVSPGGNLIWHLDGSKAVASPDYPVQCQAVSTP